MSHTADIPMEPRPEIVKAVQERIEAALQQMGQQMRNDQDDWSIEFQKAWHLRIEAAVKAERERCAKALEAFREGNCVLGDRYTEGWNDGLQSGIDKIRSGG